MMSRENVLVTVVEAVSCCDQFWRVGSEGSGHHNPRNVEILTRAHDPMSNRSLPQIYPNLVSFPIDWEFPSYLGFWNSSNIPCMNIVNRVPNGNYNVYQTYYTLLGSTWGKGQMRLLLLSYYTPIDKAIVAWGTATSAFHSKSLHQVQSNTSN